MKIALCLSGYFRGFQICFPTWKQFLLDPNHEFDAFVCTGATRDWHTLDSIDDELWMLKSGLKVVKHSIVPSVHYRFPSILSQRNFNGRNISNVLSMFNKIKLANELKKEHEQANGFKYDLVVRFRLDTFLKSKINFEYNDNALYIPNHGDWGGINDQMAWSSSANMDHYSRVYDFIVPYLRQTPKLLLDPEALLKHHLDKIQLPIHRSDILYQLARDNFNLLPDNEARGKPNQGLLPPRLTIPKLPPRSKPKRPMIVPSSAIIVDPPPPPPVSPPATPITKESPPPLLPNLSDEAKQEQQRMLREARRKKIMEEDRIQKVKEIQRLYRPDRK